MNVALFSFEFIRLVVMQPTYTGMENDFKK